MTQPPAKIQPGRSLQQEPGQPFKAAPALNNFSILGDDWLKRIVRMGGAMAQTVQGQPTVPAVPGLPRQVGPQHPMALAKALQA